MNILLATDGSKNAQWGCDLIAHIREQGDVHVHLVHVTTPLPEPMVPFPDVFVEQDLMARERMEDEHEMRAAERLEACRNMLPPGVKVTTHARVGHPAQEILSVIDQVLPDLVVMGARGMDKTPEYAIGSVSQKVVRYAPCPVVIAREKGIGNRRVLVGLDEKGDGDQVLEWLKHARWLSGCSLTLTHVVEDRYLSESRLAATQFSGSGTYLDKLQDTLKEQALAFLEREAALLADAPFQVSTLVLEGAPATALADHTRAGGFDLLVVGARGRHGLSRFLMGSTSEKVLRQAGCSVVVVRTR
ncbi:MAG: universal stress protein [Nitrospirota bacterium]|nr:universal stress protein [Nitrospirota bacterium]